MQPVVRLEDTLLRIFNPQNVTWTNEAANANPLTYTIPEDGVYEISASGGSTTTQTNGQTISLVLVNETGVAAGRLYGEIATFKSAGHTYRFETVRFFLRKNWVVFLNHDVAVALNETLVGVLNVVQLFYP